MSSEFFSKLEIDAIGEVLNISLGASATAVSTILNTRVDITTPVVNVMKKDEFEMGRVEPAVGVAITYISGLEGNNVMLLKRHDVKVIVEKMMGIEMTDEEFELNEMNISAVCEVMNQMMGASATALSEFLGKMVNISTPQSFEVKDEQEFKDRCFPNDSSKVVIGFTLKIADQLESEFFNIMPIELAKSLVQAILPESEIVPFEKKSDAEPQPAAESAPEQSGKSLSQEEIEKMLAGGGETSAPQPAAPQPVVAQPAAMPETSAPQPAAQPEAAQPVMPQMAAMPQMGAESSMMQMQMMQQMMQQMQMMQQQLQEAKEKPEPKMINVQPVTRPNLTQNKDIVLEGEQEENMELIMGVPLEISVEIGRTKKLVKDILDLTKGSLVVLDKIAGEQVDLLVNGQCIAKGDVVVVEDNFGIRITEIMKINFATLE